MKQNRKTSLKEAITNTMSGFVISFLIQIILFPIMGIPVRFEQNIIITLVFTVAGIARGYTVRRIFNK
jgi:hypothetical protein